MEKVGLLGGTFDPVHDGHLQLARSAGEELALNRVLLIPAADPPHKNSHEVTPFRHRKAMLELALAGERGLAPCYIEAELPVPSYTIDTVRLLQSRDGAAIEYYFIIGVDAFVDLSTWKEYRELLTRVSLLVAWREGFGAGERLDQIAFALGYHREPQRWHGHDGLRDIRFLLARPAGVSSSEVRRQLHSGTATVAGVRPEVVRYAIEHRLYSSGCPQDDAR